MKKKLLAVISLVLALAMFAACGSGGTSSAAPSESAPAPSEQSGESAPGEAAPAEGEKPYEGTTITVLCEGHPSSTAYDEMKAEFEAETGITVNLEIIPYEELPQKVLLGFSQGSKDYDMIMNDRLHMQGYVANDYITALDDYIANPALNQYYDAADLVPAYNNAVMYEGKTYGFPVYGESTFLMYRKDLFEEHNVKVPETMEELELAAKTIYEATNGEVAGITLRGQQGVHVVYVWGAFLWGYGGRYFDEEGKIVVDSPEAIEGTKMYVNLLNTYGPAGYSNFGWQENRLLFQQGKAAMTIDATVNGAYCEDPAESEIVGKVGYAPVPGAVTDGYGGPGALAVHGFFINNAVDDKQKEAAFLFGSWAVSAQTQEASIAVAPHSGLSSVKAMQSDAFREKYGAFSDDMIKALEVANADYMPTVTQANEIVNKVGAALSLCLAGTQTPEQALADVTKDINENVLTAG